MIITVADQDKNLCRYARYAETPPYASGWQTFSYGKLGEVTENIRTFALPFEDQPYTFAMKYEYDSWNRIQVMTYPDGEVVRYGYNFGGMLEAVTGNKHGVPYRYIDSICYNKFELKELVEYGNGTWASYDYDSLLRLSHLRSVCADGTMQDIAYTYDSVGNIQRIENGAGTLSNGLGGTYSSNYEYDDLYRLTGSTGTWAGSSALNYRTTAQYHANGRISRKNLAVRRLLNGVSDTVNYSHGYYYGNASQPNTLTRYSSSVWNPNSWLGISNEEDSQFSWDASGNMTMSCPGGEQNCRKLCWDEQNRLQGVMDNKYLSYYQYDANGDRTYKLTGEGQIQNISGSWQYYYGLKNATLYASPYLVATGQGYTKHYYAENERIASRMGGGGLQSLGQTLVDQETFLEKVDANRTLMSNVLENCLRAAHYDVLTELGNLHGWRDSVQPETDCYWYHPDHLGSSSWITHTDSHAVQHLHYLPWGEDFVNQRTGSFSSMYTFSAKEKDAETGLSYFGSRYYSSDLSIWLSVDPMAAKYPSLSPYTYCADNPVRLVDPNGEEIVITETTDEKGNRVINISFTAALVNESSRTISSEQMEAYKLGIESSLKKHYGKQYDDGTKVNVSVDLKIYDKRDLSYTVTFRHYIFIKDNCSDPQKAGYTEEGGRIMELSLAVCDNFNGKTKSNISNSFERTVAHEFGHFLNLGHDEENTNNLMNPETGGDVITLGQINTALSNYHKNQMNQGPFFSFYQYRKRRNELLTRPPHR